MKKLFVLVPAALFMLTTASAQFSIGVKSGYAFPSHGNELGYKVNGTEVTTLYGTYGTGVPVSLELRYLFNEYLGVQLDASYLFGSKVINSEDVTPGSESKTTTVTRQFRLTPQLVVQTPFGLYTRVGAVLPLAGETTRTLEVANGGGPGVKLENEVVAKGKFSAGVVGCLGYQQPLGDRLGIFAEFEYISLGIKRKSTEITKYTVGGVDVLPTVPEEIKNQEYEDKTNVGDGKSQGTKAPYSSLGFNVGVRFTF